MTCSFDVNMTKDIIGNVAKHVNVSILPSILDSVTDRQNSHSYRPRLYFTQRGNKPWHNRIFSERELTFTFAICRRPSVCRLQSR